MPDKAALRRLVRSRGQEVTAAEREAQSASVVERIRQHAAYRNAAVVMLFCPLPDEVDISPLLTDWPEKTFVLPLVRGATTMEARLYRGPESLRRGAFGIMEPTGARLDDLSQVGLVVVPGMAFDAGGHRLGRGRGYYDRFLPLLTMAWRIGVCLAHQLVESVPTEPTDIAMHEILCCQCHKIATQDCRKRFFPSVSGLASGQCN